MNIVDPILFQCRRQPPLAAICVPGPGIGLISYRRLERFIHNISRRVHALGLPAQSVIAINVGEDVIFHAAILLALTRLGMITISLRGGGVPAIQIDAVITTAEQPLSPGSRVILADLSWTEGDGTPLEPHLLPFIKETDLCRLILTSGTTDEPKAVALSHRMVADRISRHLAVFGNRLGGCSRVYCDVPISSSLGFQFLIYSLWRGGTAFFPGPDFHSTLRVIEDYNVQCMVGSPGGFENMLRWFDTIPSYQSKIEVLFCGGDILSRSLSERIRSRICSHVIAGYGSTEASMSATAHAHEIADVARAVGFVTPGVTIQIVDQSGTILPAGQEGHVRVMSEYAVDRYFRNPKASAGVFRDGWFYPGDLGQFTSEGLLVITGREQAVLNLGGDKLNPEKVELVLLQFKGVIEAAVFGLPNEYGNNEVCAAVACRDKLDEQALRAHCEALVPRGFAPVRFIFADSLPHNDMGKVDRRRLLDLIPKR